MEPEPTSERAYELIDVIQGYLEGHGWHFLEPSGRRWVDHTYDHGSGSVRVRYLPGVARLVIDVDVRGATARLAAWFTDDDPGALLRFLVEQRDLSDVDAWAALVEGLRVRSARLTSVAGAAGGEREVHRSTPAADLLRSHHGPKRSAIEEDFDLPVQPRPAIEEGRGGTGPASGGSGRSG